MQWRSLHAASFASSAHASIDICTTKHAAAAGISFLFGLAFCLIVHPELNFPQGVSQMRNSREETPRTKMAVGSRDAKNLQTRDRSHVAPARARCSGADTGADVRPRLANLRGSTVWNERRLSRRDFYSGGRRQEGRWSTL